MKCKHLLICKKPESNLPHRYDNTGAEKTNLSPVRSCTGLFYKDKLIDFSRLSTGVNSSRIQGLSLAKTRMLKTFWY